MVAAIVATLVSIAHADVPVSTNFPSIQSAVVEPGSVQATIEFEVSSYDAINVTVIAPVAGSEFSLLDPDDAVVVGNTAADFSPGADYDPPLPGGVFSTGKVLNPVDGTWKVRLEYPAAAERTALLASLYFQSQYQAGIVVARNSINTGEDLPIGLLVMDNGAPIAGLSPTISILKDNVVIASGLLALDDGSGPDGLAADGVYSISHTFTEAGVYQVTGDVTIPDGGDAKRVPQAEIVVTDPRLVVSSVEFLTTLGADDCIDEFAVRINADILDSGAFVAGARLSNADEVSILESTSFPEVVGPTSVDLVFPVTRIIESLGLSDSYFMGKLEVLDFTPDIKLAYLEESVDPLQSFDGADFCRKPVMIVGKLSEEPAIDNQDQILGLNISFPIIVQSPGSYTIYFSVVGPMGEDIGEFTFTRELVAGENLVTEFLGAEYVLNIDGPYRVISVRVDGGDESGELSDLGETRPYNGADFFDADPTEDKIFNDGFEASEQ